MSNSDQREGDPHRYSTRPCSTCAAISALLARPFGCDAKRAREAPR